MTTILLPIAGKATDFINSGYNLPKPLLPVNGVPMIKSSLTNLLTACGRQCRLIFLVLEEHCINYDIGNVLRDLFADWPIQVVHVSTVTEGALCTCLLAKHLLISDDRLLIFTPDILFHSNFMLERDFVECDGLLLTFKANSPKHSYVTCTDDGWATKVAEKSVISNTAIVGVYGFDSSAKFIHYAEAAIAGDLRTQNLFYIAPIYNLLLKDGLKIKTIGAERIYVFDTPTDLLFYEEFVVRYELVNRLALCCDHSGFMTKKRLIKILDARNIQYSDFGAYTIASSDHYEALRPCIEFLNKHTQTFGIAICSTGQGFNIAANKAKGIRSALITNQQMALMSRRHNAANFFCLPAHLTDDDLSGIIDTIMTAPFDGGRHATRIQKIANDALFIK